MLTENRLQGFLDQYKEMILFLLSSTYRTKKEYLWLDEFVKIIQINGACLFCLNGKFSDDQVENLLIFYNQENLKNNFYSYYFLVKKHKSNNFILFLLEELTYALEVLENSIPDRQNAVFIDFKCLEGEVKMALEKWGK